jgi:hypothetical protein
VTAFDRDWLGLIFLLAGLLGFWLAWARRR